MLHGGNVLNTFWTTELNNEMLRHGLKRSRLRFSEICGKIKGWNLKPRHFVVVEGISYLKFFFKKKIKIWNQLGGVQSFWKLFYKIKAARKQCLVATGEKIERANDSKSVFRAGITHAQTLFNSVVLNIGENSDHNVLSPAVLECKNTSKYLFSIDNFIPIFQRKENERLIKRECLTQTLFGVLTKTYGIIQKRLSIYDLRLRRGIVFNFLATKEFC